eukprot:3258047-Amphidinium_carterae.1
MERTYGIETLNIEKNKGACLYVGCGCKSFVPEMHFATGFGHCTPADCWLLSTQVRALETLRAARRLHAVVSRPLAMNRMGVRQRLRASNVANEGVEGSCKGRSVLAEYLLKEWAWGRMPATTVQTIAALARADGSEHSDVARHS